MSKRHEQHVRNPRFRTRCACRHDESSTREMGHFTRDPDVCCDTCSSSSRRNEPAWVRSCGARASGSRGPHGSQVLKRPRASGSRGPHGVAQAATCLRLTWATWVAGAQAPTCIRLTWATWGRSSGHVPPAHVGHMGCSLALPGRVRIKSRYRALGIRPKLLRARGIVRVREGERVRIKSRYRALGIYAQNYLGRAV